MANQNRKNNIRQYRKPLNINIGMIIFGIIFIYIIICVFLYFTSKHITRYEVKAGTLSVQSVYQGIALRQEEIINCNDSGYVNYYAREGGRVAVGDLIYTVDETGKLSEALLAEEMGENSLSDSDLTQLKTEIAGFRKSFLPTSFAQVYDFKYTMQGTALKLANSNILENIDRLGQGGSGQITLCNAVKTGIVVYNTDGFEAVKAEEITKDSFSAETYKKQQLISNELINNGEPVYKLCTSENWSIVIPLEQERAEELAETEYLQVRFLKNQDISWAKVTLFQNSNDYFARLDFTNSMITFCTDRFIDIELITEQEVGLKIPNSSIVEKEFFLVPREYIVSGGDGTSSGVMKESYLEDGSVSTEWTPVTLYNETETDYYVDDSVLKIGDYLMKPDSTEKYPVSKKGTLIGVYNMNKGYADFKQILILYQNEEYSIVQSNTKYGLSVYDHIVLDAKSVTENEIITQ